MNETKVNNIVGSKHFSYTSPKSRKTVKYAVSIYNEDLKSLNFYFFNVNEDWMMEKENPNSPFVITVYELGMNNELTSHTKSWRIKSIPGNFTSKITYQGNNIIQPTLLNTKDLDVDVNQHVPVPNTLTLQFVQNSCPLSSNTSYYILILTEKTTGIKYIERIVVQPRTRAIKSRVSLNSRQRYQYQLYKVHEQNKKLTVTHETRLLSVVTHNKRADVSNLMDLAQNHLRRKGSNIATVRHLYRNKPTTHPTIRNAMETGVMEKYIKDNNGDPGSSINNKIRGLFFMATPKTTSGQVPDDSFFGNYRIMIPPDHLVQGCHLYFADFTCLAGKSHYITLVLTKVNSEEDRYCRNRLVPLDLNDNPFFYTESGRFYVPLAPYLHIEILYTEDVNLLELKRLKLYGSLDFRQYILDSHLVRGRGQSKPDGIAKPPSCGECNLPPILPRNTFSLW